MSSEFASRLGRPSLINRVLIVKTALSIGDEKRITMTRIAAELGVSIGALYRHVPNHDELMRLVADARIVNQLLPQDVGQHWSDYLREYSAMIYECFCGRPSLILEYANGRFSPESEVKEINDFLAFFQKRCFSAADAFEIKNDMRAIALGSALVATAMHSVSERTGSIDKAVDVALSDFTKVELYELRSVEKQYRAFVRDPSSVDPIDRLIRAIADQRGEKLPIVMAARRSKWDSAQPSSAAEPVQSS